MNQATTGKYAERIERGAALLDERAPGWRQRIDLEKLELSSCTTCVLGQVAGSTDPWGWREVRLGFGLDYSAAEDHGFSLTDSEYLAIADDIEDVNDVRAYRSLTDAWKQYIEATR
jgi:hypothetical protein